MVSVSIILLLSAQVKPLVGGIMEKHYRVNEVAQLTGLAVATIRKKVLRREIGYRKGSRAVLIPASEIEKLLGSYRPAIELGAAK